MLGIWHVWPLTSDLCTLRPRPHQNASLQALSVESKLLEDERFQSICFRQNENSQGCTPPFSFASFMHAPLESYISGTFQLQAEYALLRQHVKIAQLARWGLMVVSLDGVQGVARLPMCCEMSCWTIVFEASLHILNYNRRSLF